MNTDLITTISDFARQVLDGSDMFLVDVEIKGAATSNISVYVDTEEGGVNIDQCAKISRELIFLLESHEVLGDKFTLNVSSPGLDRPLKDERQFAKNVGRKASVKFTSDGATQSLKGTLHAVNENVITIKTDKGATRELNRETILETRILPAF